MRSARRVAVAQTWKTLVAAVVVAVAALVVALGAPVRAESLSLDEVLSGVVRIKTFINLDGLTRENLGKEREGTGIVIDNAGLVLTIGYLMVEAYAAEIVTNDGHTVPANVVGYDNETGFGLLQAITPLKVRPVAMGKSSEVKNGDPGSSPATGNTCSTRQSSPRRRTPPGAALR
jgi:S1-C subfamily serine protease